MDHNIQEKINQIKWHVRFWKKVKKTDSCWLWTASTKPGGYGQFRLNYKNVMPHRISYQLKFGIIKSGLEIDHLCRNKICINPEHLEAVPHHINMSRTLKSHCIRRHKFTQDNIYKRKNLNTRYCRACAKIRDFNYRLRKGK